MKRAIDWVGGGKMEKYLAQVHGTQTEYKWPRKFGMNVYKHHNISNGIIFNLLNGVTNCYKPSNERDF